MILQVNISNLFRTISLASLLAFIGFYTLIGIRPRPDSSERVMQNELIGFLLNTAKTNIKFLDRFKNVLIVLGNETCDLDSAVSSLVYSLLLHHRKTPESVVIPVFNIPRVQLPVKTEVTYFLQKYGVNLNSTICRDDVDLEALQKRGSLQLSLVDHHALPPSDKQLFASVKSVIDHRPQDPAWPWPHVDLTLRTVGSCSTLVAEKLLAEAPELVNHSVATLLLGTILLDTACLSPEMGRATPLDHQMADQLEALCDPPVDRVQMFTELQKAKSDIASLTTSQLLIKDLKVTAGIPIAGLPMKVKEFLKRADATIAVQEFCDEHNTDLCVVYGSGMEQGTLTRDIAVYSLSSMKADKVVVALSSHKEPSLDLQPQPCSVEGFLLFDQLNIKATRKHVLPIIRDVGEALKTE